MDKQPIIIKKVKKGHAGAHGGAWKVAYADFVTAMMAFFLLMWLLNMTSDEKKIKLALYFQEFSIFEKGGAPVETSPVGEPLVIPPILNKQTTGQESKNKVSGDESGESSAAKNPQEQKLEEEPVDNNIYMDKEQLKTELTAVIEKRLNELKDQVIVETFDKGVRVQLIDKQGNPLFAVGSSQPTPEAKKALRVLSDSLKDLPNRIAIEGHTDSLAYAGSHYTNWELSTDRASAARKELEASGLNPERLVKVAGYAATNPLVKDKPEDPRNRRISILIFDKQAKVD